MTLDLQSPLASRLAAWSKERFPPAHGVLALVLYAAALLYGRMLVVAGPVVLSLRDGFGYLAAWSFFLMLRVFDEHKDYDQDVRNHPQRVLQRGLITLGHLKVVGAVAIAIQIGANLAADGGVGKVTQLWMLVFFWSSLMAKEFFVGEWLNEHLVLYGLSHMVVMPMALVWMTQFGALDAAPSASVLELAAMAFMSGASLEVARKIRAPEDEREGVDTYSKSIGLRGAPVTAVVFVMAGSGILCHLLLLVSRGDVSPVYWAVVALGLLVATFAAVSFLRAPSSKGAKGIENATAIQMLVSYITLIACIANARGIQWR